MDHPKYIIVDISGLEIAILFNCILDHSTVANGYKTMAAGFCSIARGPDGEVSVSAWGQSRTLETAKKFDERGQIEGFVSRPEDARIIQKSLYLD